MAQADDYDLRKRRLPKKQGVSTGLVIGLILGGVAFLFLICCGLALGLYLFVLPETNSRLTEQNLKKVQVGMTLEEAEKILGKASKATDDDVSEANGKGQPFGFGATIQFRPGATKYRWRNGNTWVFVDVDDQSKKIVSIASVSGS